MNWRISLKEFLKFAVLRDPFFGLVENQRFNLLRTPVFFIFSVVIVFVLDVRCATRVSFVASDMWRTSASTPAKSRSSAQSVLAAIATNESSRSIRRRTTTLDSRRPFRARRSLSHRQPRRRRHPEQVQIQELEAATATMWWPRQLLFNSRNNNNSISSFIIISSNNSNSNSSSNNNSSNNNNNSNNSSSSTCWILRTLFTCPASPFLKSC